MPRAAGGREGPCLEPQHLHNVLDTWARVLGVRIAINLHSQRRKLRFEEISCPRTPPDSWGPNGQPTRHSASSLRGKPVGLCPVLPPPGVGATHSRSVHSVNKHGQSTHHVWQALFEELEVERWTRLLGQIPNQQQPCLLLTVLRATYPVPVLCQGLH